jgi:hypothetical protein
LTHRQIKNSIDHNQPGHFPQHANAAFNIFSTQKNNMPPSTTRVPNSRNDSIEPTFSWVSLSIAFVLFLATAPYWLISADSPASLINALLNRSDNGMTEYGRFFAHIVATVVGMALLVSSRIHEWTSWKISTSSTFVRFFYKNARKTDANLRVLRIILIGAACVFLYFALLNATNRNTAPRMECAIILFISVLVILTWNIRHIQPETIRSTGFVKSFNKTKWISLDESQIQAAYIMDPHVDENLWHLTTSRTIDLSYKEAYVFNRNDMNKELKEEVLSENIGGKVKYYFKIAAEIEKFPRTMKTDQVKALAVNFFSEENLRTVIFLTIGKDKIKSLDELWLDISESIAKAWNTTNNLHHNIGQQLQNQLGELWQKTRDFSAIGTECNMAVRDKIRSIFDDVDMFTIIFDLKDASDFKAEYEKLKKAVEERAKILRDRGDETEQAYTKAGLDIITNPGMSTSRLKELQQLKEAHQNTMLASGGEKPALEASSSVEKKIAAEILVRVIRNIQELAQISKGGFDRNMAVSLIANSTNFFVDNKIEPDEFIKLTVEKLNAEKEERTQEAWIQFVEDTLTQLTSDKK